MFNVDEAVDVAAHLDGSVNEKTKMTYFVSGVIKSVTTAPTLTLDQETNTYTLTTTVILEGTSADLTLYKITKSNMAEAFANETRDNIKVGSTVYVKGVLQNYGGTMEIPNGVLINVYPHGALQEDPLTSDEAVALIGNLHYGTDGSPEVYYYVNGVITSLEITSNNRYNLVLDGVLGIYQARLQGVSASDIEEGKTVLVKGRLYNDEENGPFIRGSTYIIQVK